MKKYEKIQSKFKYVTFITGLNYYSKKVIIPVLGKIPTKIDYNLMIGLRKTKRSRQHILLCGFNMKNYSEVIVNGKILRLNIDY